MSDNNIVSEKPANKEVKIFAEQVEGRAPPGLVKIMLSFAMLLLIIEPTFIPHRFGILEFGFKVFCPL
jgi:hypothetical protein